MLLAAVHPGHECAGAGHVRVADAVQHEVLGRPHLLAGGPGAGAAPLRGVLRERAGHGADEQAEQEQPEEDPQDQKEHSDHFPPGAVARICSMRLLRP